MTSGNISEEPIAIDNDEARTKLFSLADALLLHNRNIHTRCDDSVTRILNAPQQSKNSFNPVFVIRRSRGYSPIPIELPWESIPLLAVGAELKNTFCLNRNRYAFISQYMGDIQNYETFNSFEESIKHFEKLFRIEPELLVCDLHPDYLTTRYAQERSATTGRSLITVQHHHAHIASVMTENKILPGCPVIGLAFDGTGYGDDNWIWGGEFLITTYRDYERAFHIEYFPLPGGDLAIKHPARTALAYLWNTDIEWDPDLDCVSHFCAEDRLKLLSQLKFQINTPLTSSLGRLFDAVASFLNIRQKVTYEAQAAIELEAILDPEERLHYPFEIKQPEIKIKPMLRGIINDIYNGIPAQNISARFHNTIVAISVEVSSLISKQTGIRTVALSGGVWQNKKLLEKTLNSLEALNYKVIFHHEIPTNDSGISLGQAAVAQNSLPSNNQ